MAPPHYFFVGPGTDGRDVGALPLVPAKAGEPRRSPLALAECSGRIDLARDWQFAYRLAPEVYPKSEKS